MVAKQLAVGAVGGLKGLLAMGSEGEFAGWLNSGPRAGDTRYLALASDYTPTGAGLAEFAKNRLLDAIFKEPNDLVVPTQGVFGPNGSGFFPVEDKLVLSGRDTTAHTDYFKSSKAQEQVLRWLTV